MNLIRYYIIILLLITGVCSYCQQRDTSLNKLQQLPSKFYIQVDKKLNSINDKLTRKSVKYLAKFQRHEKILQQKLAKIDSGTDTFIFM